jgi:hypothetical protein
MAIGLSGAGGGQLFAAPPSTRSRGSVLAYFNDGLLADDSSRLPPYRRPAGYRGAGRLARMSEHERLSAGLAV